MEGPRTVFPDEADCTHVDMKVSCLSSEVLDAEAQASTQWVTSRSTYQRSQDAMVVTTGRLSLPITGAELSQHSPSQAPMLLSIFRNACAYRLAGNAQTVSGMEGYSSGAYAVG